MKIRGKEYMEVKDRVMVFRKNHPSWALITEIIENNESTGSVIFKVIIEDEVGRIRGTGHAHEFKEDKTSMVNKTSHLENCETSAIGRALASIGIGIESSYATYDEVKIAIDKGERPEKDNSVSTESKVAKKSSVKVIKGDVKANWKDYKLDKGKHAGKTLEQISEEDSSYIRWMSGIDIQDASLKDAIDSAVKGLDGNGKQRFERIG